MKASAYFLPTLREAPRDADIASHRLLIRGGFIRSLAAGIASYLPLGWRVHEKIARIVREEMDRIGGVEVHMPTLVPGELLDETGRSAVPILFPVTDRNDRRFYLGFTHEEVVTDIVRSVVSSWKQLPLLLYQIQAKERDEPRPRGGLIRGREFTMYDGYSFDADRAGLDSAYSRSYAAYEAVFRRCGLAHLAVEADPGAIGGTENHEFMVLAESGEDTVLTCPNCRYAANAERAETVGAPPSALPTGAVPAAARVSTPGARTVDEVTAFLDIGADKLIKTIVCVADGATVIALVRGDRELNTIKLARALGVAAAEPGDPERVISVTGAPVGFAGPVNLGGHPTIVADHELNTGSGYVTGANEADTHLKNVVPGRDFVVTLWADVRTLSAGDTCPRCKSAAMATARGIEVGHIFKLGTIYSEAMRAVFQPESGERQPIVMGCYGLGVSRTMAAAVEAGHDESGIIWPISIAPFEVVIIVASSEDTAQAEAAESLYRALVEAGVDVLLDDRAERAGVKFKDAELIGYPVQCVVGRGVEQGTVEVGVRRDAGARDSVPLAEAAGRIVSMVRNEFIALQTGAD